MTKFSFLNSDFDTTQNHMYTVISAYLLSPPLIMYFSFSLYFSIVASVSRHSSAHHRSLLKDNQETFSLIERILTWCLECKKKKKKKKEKENQEKHQYTIGCIYKAIKTLLLQILFVYGSYLATFVSFLKKSYFIFGCTGLLLLYEGFL